MPVNALEQMCNLCTCICVYLSVHVHKYVSLSECLHVCAYVFMFRKVSMHVCVSVRL